MSTTPVKISLEQENPPEVVNGDLLKRTTIPAQPLGLWTMAVEDLTRYVRLKIRVKEGSCWSYTSDGRMCSAAGSRTPGSGCLCPTAAVGALIAKFGGSNADDTSSGATTSGTATDQAAAAVAALASGSSSQSGSSLFNVIAVGTYCVASVPTGFIGPLFLTMNDKPSAFGSHSGSLEVEVWGIAGQRESK